MKTKFLNIIYFLCFFNFASGQIPGSPNLISNRPNHTSNGYAIISGYTCSTASAGNMQVGVAVSGVTQTITATVTKAGTYNIAAINNGVTFAASGTFTTTGTQNIVLNASGIPTVGGSNNFTLNTTPNCSFSRIIFYPSTNGTANVSGYTCSISSTGSLSTGIAVSGVTQTISADVTALGSYNISSTVNGVTFAANGTFTILGTQNITLTATGTPTTFGSNSFTLNTSPNCNFSRTVNYGSTNGSGNISGYTNCSTNSAGTLTASVAASGVTQTITANFTTGGTYSISTTDNGITFAGSGTHTTGTNKTIVLTASGTPIAVGANTFTLNTLPNCNFSRTTIPNPSSNGTAVVSSYTCSTSSSGALILSNTVSGVTQTITANVTTLGTYNISTTANDVTFAASGTFTTLGAQDITLTATGIPTNEGAHTFTLNTTPNCNFSRTTTFTCGQTITFTYYGSSVTYGTVTSNGKCWLDRNLGATQVATSSSDAASYGDLYNWGRLADGHQLRTSGKTQTRATTDTPGNANFIYSFSASQNDWRNPKNNNLWQGVSGINNPCPSNFRLPTSSEFSSETATWSNQGPTGAFNSALKLPLAGTRDWNDGNLRGAGTHAYYSTSSIHTSNTTSMYLLFYSTPFSNLVLSNLTSTQGMSVRCIKN